MTPVHEKLPDDRKAHTHKVIINGKNIFITTGFYADGRLAEVFVKADKEGAELALLNVIAVGISVGLQHGIPLVKYTRKYKHHRLGTPGPTDDPEIHMAKGLLDYLARYLENNYLTAEERVMA